MIAAHAATAVVGSLVLNAVCSKAICVTPYSGAKRPLIPVESGQRFWTNPATVLADSGQGGAV